MISKEEAREVVSSIKAAVLNDKFEDAIAQLKNLYESHFRDATQSSQQDDMKQFITHIREYFGFGGKLASLAGISTTEMLYKGYEHSTDQVKQAKYSDLNTLLRVGRAIFEGEGNTTAALEALHSKFAPAGSTHQPTLALTP